MFDFLKARGPEDRFAERVIRRLRERGWRHEVTYNAEDFSLDAGAERGQLYLGNIYTELQTYPRAQQAAQLDRALNVFFEMPAEMSLADAAPKLLPVVRNLMHLQATALANEHDPSTELWQPFTSVAGPLGAFVAIDLPTSVAIISHEMLHEWGCSFEAAMDRAMENLIALSPVKFEPADGGFHISAYGDAHDSSRVLMPELFPAIQVKGDPVAIVVSRTCVTVAGSLETDALLAMADFALSTWAAEVRPTSCLPIVLRDGAWAPFEPPEPELAPLRTLALRQVFTDYSAQTPLLEAYLAHMGRNMFVAPLEVTVVEGSPHSWTTWTEGVAALLPRAEVMGLTASDGRRLIRRWADIEAVCGAFVEDASLHPPRFTGPSWPFEAAWRRLEQDFPEPEWWSAEPASAN